MTITLKFLSAVVRKEDVEAHYPGGCAAFEHQHLVGSEDDALYALFDMSSGGIDDRIEELRQRGFDVERYVAVGDMWHGPIRQVPGIRLYAKETGDMFPVWHAVCATEDSHD